MDAVRDGDCALSEAREAISVEIPVILFRNGGVAVGMGGGSRNSALG